MSLSLPQATFAKTGLPRRSLGTLPAADPTVIGDTQGLVPDYGTVQIEVSAACTASVFIWSPATKAWRHPSSASASYQKVFSEAVFDYLAAPPGARFFVRVATGTVTGYTDAPDANGADTA